MNETDAAPVVQDCFDCNRAILEHLGPMAALYCVFDFFEPVTTASAMIVDTVGIGCGNGGDLFVISSNTQNSRARATFESIKARSDEPRGGKEWVRTGRTRGAPDH